MTKIPSDRKFSRRDAGSGKPGEKPRQALHGTRDRSSRPLRSGAGTRPLREDRPGQKPASPRDLRFDCPVSARCGGCQLSRMNYQEQLRWKQERVEALLAPLCPVEPIRGMAVPYHYRNKVHAVFATDKRGLPISGVYAAGTHRVVPVRHCLIEDERADRIIQTITSMLPAFKLRIYNEYTHRGFLRHVLVRTGHVSGQIMVVLVATSLEFPGRKEFVAELLARHKEITTLVLNLNDRETSMVLGKKEVVLYGDGFIEDTLCGKVFRLSPQSFYQVNAVQTEVLYRTAIDLAGLTGTETVLDAYCGVGTIGLCASGGCGQLIGVELNPEAVRDARENAKRNGANNAVFACDDAGRFMTRMAREGKHADVVFMDPPRSGSDEKFLRAVLTLAPDRVVYVSCDPDTLARDAAYLCQGGYRAVKAVPVDMFPCTEHVETVCLLSKLSNTKHHVEVELNLDEMDLTTAESKATYDEIRDYVMAQTGLHVTNLNIAQIKRKCGIIERENYNLPKTENTRQPKCTKEKEEAIKKAFIHFGMI